MNDTTDEKSCKKCKYFITHYYWCNCKLKETAFGHCAKHRYKNFYRLFPLKNGCPLWEIGETLKEEEIKKIADVLTEMAERVDNIASYLEKEKLNDGELF